AQLPQLQQPRHEITCAVVDRQDAIPPIAEVSADHRGFDARVETRREERVHPTATDAHHAETFCIRLRNRFEVIDGAHPIPSAARTIRDRRARSSLAPVEPVPDRETPASAPAPLSPASATREPCLASSR